MKKVLLLMVCALMGFALNAQVSDDFSDYDLGGKIAQQAQAMGRDYWTTWDDAPGTAEDGVVNEAPDGTQAGYWTYGNDQILKLGQKDTGVWEVAFKMWIPTGTCGYFNIQANFTGDQDGDWAIEAYVGCGTSSAHNLTPGKGALHAGGSNAATFNFDHDTWINFKLYINLDDDEANISVNDNVIHSWVYTSGAQSGCPKIIDALNIFPPIAGAKFYITDIVFEETIPLLPAIVSIDPTEIEIKLKPGNTAEAPFNIISEVEGSSAVVWSAYVDYSPIAIEAGSEFTLAICDPYIEPTGGIGWGGDDAFTVEIAIKLTVADYANELGGVLKKIGFFVMGEDAAGDFSPADDLRFRVYGQGPAINMQGEVLAEIVLEMKDFEEWEWNFVDIDPVQLTGSEVWIAVQITGEPGSHPASHDSNFDNDNGNWVRFGEGSWGKTTIEGNCWAIQTIGDGKTTKAWGYLDNPYGITFAATESEVNAIANSTGFEEGEYTATIVILTNIEDYDYFEIPFTMIVCEECASNDVRVKEVFVDGEKADLEGEMYRISIETTELTAEIVVITEDENATVEGAGVQPLNEPNAMGISTTDFVFTVIAEDGVTTKDYDLRVIAQIDKPAIAEITNEMALYPNPVSDYLYIKTDVVIEQVTIYDLAGKVVKQVKQPATSINLSDLASGFYMLKATTPQGEMMQKFIKE